MTSSRRLVVLLSVGLHPARGRRGASPHDRSAVELALRSNFPALGLYAGPADDPALGDYLHMGLPAVEVVRVEDGCDVVPSLAAGLRRLEPAAILAGSAAGSGRGSGEVPFRIGAALGCPTIAGIQAFAPHEGGWLVTIAAGRGRQRQVVAPLGSIMLPDAGRVVPRYGRYRARRDGEIKQLDLGPVERNRTPSWVARPAGRHPAPLAPIRGETAAERLDRILGRTGPGAAKGARPMSPEAAADLILASLRERRVGRFSVAGIEDSS